LQIRPHRAATIASLSRVAKRTLLTKRLLPRSRIGGERRRADHEGGKGGEWLARAHGILDPVVTLTGIVPRFAQRVVASAFGHP
jgi:hypothetical protein